MTRWAVLLVPILGILVVDATPDYHAVKFVVLLAGCFAGVATALLEAPRPAWSRLHVALWCFVAAQGLMLARSPMPGRAVRAFALLLALTLLHHAACATTSRRWLRRATPYALGGLGALLGAIAIGQWAAGAPQAAATFANRNFAAVGLAMLLPFALALRGPARWAATALAAGGLAATTSRGGLLAAAAAFGLWLVWSRPNWRWPMLALPVLVLAAGLAFGEANTVKVRVHWYKAALSIGAAHPVLGAGADGFRREYPPIRPLEEHQISGGDTVHAVHNDYLQAWADGGALGLLALLFLAVAAARAVRRDRTAAASLLALGVAALVDLPLRDPSLLALAFLVFTLAAPRRRVRARAVMPALVGLLVMGAMFPDAWWHWQAERALRDGDVDRALAREPRHPDALLLRGRPEDLDALIELEPHHAGAHYNQTRDLSPDEAAAALAAIHRDHDPHHVLTFFRRAQLCLKDDPLRAVALLDDAIQADPRRVEPYGLLARLYRERGLLDQAKRNLLKAEARAFTVDVARERLAFEIAELDEQRWGRSQIVRAMRRLPVEEARAPIRQALAEARRIEDAATPPRVAREAGEAADAYARRVGAAKNKHREGVAKQTMRFYLRALVLADALTDVHPTSEHLLLLARAAQGLGDEARMAQAGALALLAEALEAAAAGAATQAEGKLAQALKIDPSLPDQPLAKHIVQDFAQRHPDAVPAAERLLRDLVLLKKRLRGRGSRSPR